MGGHRYGCQDDYEDQAGLEAFSAPVRSLLRPGAPDPVETMFLEAQGLVEAGDVAGAERLVAEAKTAAPVSQPPTTAAYWLTQYIKGDIDPRVAIPEGLATPSTLLGSGLIGSDAVEMTPGLAAMIVGVCHDRTSPPFNRAFIPFT